MTLRSLKNGRLVGNLLPASLSLSTVRVGRNFSGKNSLGKRKGILLRGFNPSEKYESKWESSSNMDEQKKIFEKTT